MNAKTDPFAGYASGWFVTCFSEELKPGDVRPLSYFGQELVMFRTASGEPRILDAYCPHMGAHLGHGGKVNGEGITCPFHAWTFDGSGACTDVPYASKIPPRAKIECWSVREKNGMIFVWHDRGHGPPTWEIPDIEGFGTDAWTPWFHGMLEVKRHPREIVENVVDVGHFIPVHGTHVDEIRNEFTPLTATQINRGTAYPLGGGKDHYELNATYHGPAWQLTRMKGYLDVHLINTHIPVDEHTLQLRFAVSAKQSPDKPVSAEFLQTYVQNLREGFFQDIRIWENMTYRSRPILCDGDGPIIKLRQWYRAFYQAEAKRQEALAAG